MPEKHQWRHQTKLVASEAYMARDRQQNIINLKLHVCQKVIKAMKKIEMFNSIKGSRSAVAQERVKNKDGLEASIG